jgi:endonuclease/exonuclease/phosphatase family metal-dependent hydrolase
MVAECRSLCGALREYRTLAALKASPGWASLGPRLEAVLSTVRRHEPRHDPGEPPDPRRLMAVHWNIEHGNRYPQVVAALRDHPQLQSADLVLLNEVDLGVARSGNRDVAGELCRALDLHGVWVPQFMETIPGRDCETTPAENLDDQEALFGLAILSRWPIGEVRRIELPSPEEFQFRREGMFGRPAALVARIERPEEPLVAVAVHLQVYGTRRDRARQMTALTAALAREGRPVILAGDFNSHTFDRGRWWDPLAGAATFLFAGGRALEKRLLHPDRGRHHERLFDVLRESRFEWHALNDRRPTLRLRFDRLHESKGWLGRLPLIRPVLRQAERRANLRLDWFTGRDWRRGRGATVVGLDGPGRASDHAPIVAEFR